MKKIVCLVLALLMCLTLFACGQTEKALEAETKPAETETPAEETTPAPDAEPVAEENPENYVLRLGATDDFTGQGMNMIFDTLTWRVNMFTAEPYIISVESTEDYTQYTLTLTDGVTFSDGTPVTIDIIKYSIEALSATSNLGFMSMVDKMEITDDHTIQVTFTAPYMGFAYDLSYIYCVKEGSVSEEGLITEYVGTGCFVLDDFQIGTSATFSANENYWNPAKKPAVKTVEWKVIPDETARVMALESGEIDALGISEHANALSYATLNELKDVDGIVMDFHKDGSPAMYMYNYTDGPMTDLALRKAVTLAIDRQGIADAVTYGFGTGLGTYMTEDAQFAARNGESFKYDPDEAKQVLADAGYVDTDGDGILEKDGENIVLDILTLSSDTYRTTAVLVGENLAAIGIGSNIEALESAAYREKSPVGDFDICFTHPWTTAVAYMTWRGGYSDYDGMGTGFGFAPEMADYVEAIKSASSNETIQEVMDKVWAAAYEFYPATPLYSGANGYVYADYVSGIIPTRGTQNLIDLSEIVINRG